MSPILGIWASSKVSATPDTGAMFPLQVITVGATNTSTITFTNIPSTYSHLQIRGLVFTAGTGDNSVAMRFNSDSGTNYSLHALYGSGSSASSYASTNSTFAELAYTGTSTYPYAFVCDILDYANTNKYKTTRSLFGQDTNGGGYIVLGSSNWRNTNAITSISFTRSGGSGNFSQGTQFALYAVKGAA